MTRELAERTARATSKVVKETIHVVEVDDRDSRGCYTSRGDHYINSDEFEAFNGEVLCSYYNGKLVD